MSHNNHKNNTNHVNYSKMSTTVETTPAIAVVDQTAVEPIPAIVVVDQTEFEPVPTKPIDGIVSGCKKLNVRIKPSTAGDIVCVVAEGTTLMIDPSESTDKWFKVYTETGVEGYCMKNFVTINS